jgi:hypothetical protein
VNVFTALLKLYKGSELKTPLEDFTTEILVNILGEDQSLTDCFVNTVLNIPGTTFQVSSQGCFPYKKDGRQFIKVDMVFRNEDSICFLENKVHSKEGDNQLKSYSDVLNNFVGNKSTYLRYCTKFHEHKPNMTNHFFLQFRWSHISDFLKKNDNLEIVKTFLNFLESNQMGNSTEFTIEELLSLQHFNSVLMKMNAYIDKINPTFTSVFGSPKSLRAGSELLKNSRVVLIKEGLFGVNYTEIGCGFEYKDTPKLMVWIWATPNTPEALVLKDLIVSEDVYVEGGYLEVSRPLTNYLSSDEMELEIEEWFLNTFALIRKIIVDNELVCNIPIISKDSLISEMGVSSTDGISEILAID